MSNPVNEIGLYKVFKIEGLNITGTDLSMTVPEDHVIVTMSFAEGHWFVVTVPDPHFGAAQADQGLSIVIEGTGLQKDDLSEILGELVDSVDELRVMNGDKDDDDEGSSGNTIN